jgi:dethiobiotin synthetase
VTDRGRAAPGLFVTGTDTGAGKTVVAAAIAAALTTAGRRVAAFKPAVTGLDEPDPVWPMDHELLAACVGGRAADVTPYAFGPPLSPHRAAELAGVAIDPAVLVERARTAAAAADVLVAEGVGGLLVPLTLGYLVRDLAVDLALPVVVAARAGLGTINHTLLTVEAARAAGLRVAAVAMGPWPAADAVDAEAAAEAAAANADAVTRLGDVPVVRVPRVGAPTVAALAEAGGTLPIEEWLAA